MTTTSATMGDVSSPARGNVDDSDYLAHLVHLEGHFHATLTSGPLFTTDAEGLWDAYLASFPPSDRQFHSCNACRRLIDHFGGLVVIGADGTTTPALWNSDVVQGQELAAVAAMERLVRRARVTGPFLSKEATLGLPVTGVWRHMSATLPPERVFANVVLTAGQAMAEKREDYRNVQRALTEFSADMVGQALSLLKSEALYRSEKVLGQAQWLADLHTAVAEHKGRRDNIVWRFVALAPAGFCHPRSSMIGTLLEDIAAGVSFETAARKFAEKMHPLQYQRPQAAPSTGNIREAEKLVEKLGIGASLVRRFARLGEIQALWLAPLPTAPSSAGGGVFGHLQPKGSAPPGPRMTAPAQAITWEKFARTALPTARDIQVKVPPHGAFFALLTAANPDAPPILQWDSAEQRNPFSWYTYHRGSPAPRWGLAVGWAKVNAITLNPAQWFGGGHDHQGKGAIVIIDGARDSMTEQGNALFPETLKTELRAVRATIEAYSKTAKIEGYDEASACGLNAIGATLLVTDAAGVSVEYRIDRLD